MRRKSSPKSDTIAKSPLLELPVLDANKFLSAFIHVAHRDGWETPDWQTCFIWLDRATRKHPTPLLTQMQNAIVKKIQPRRPSRYHVQSSAR